MKNKSITQLILTIALFFSTAQANAQDGKKIVAVINRADWCTVCIANGEKIMKEVIPVFSESNVQFIMNDLTSDATKGDSKMKLEKAKVHGVVKKISATGLLLLIDAETGKLLEKISVGEPAEKIVMMIKQLSMMDKM